MLLKMEILLRRAVVVIFFQHTQKKVFKLYKFYILFYFILSSLIKKKMRKFSSVTPLWLLLVVTMCRYNVLGCYLIARYEGGH